MSYVLLTVLMVSIILIGYRRQLNKVIENSGIRKNKFNFLLLFFVAWFSYLFLLSNTETLTIFTLPPRFVLFLLIPLVLICVIFYRKNLNNPVFTTMPLTWTVYYQTFRIIVEILILYTFYKGIMPKEASFEGYNFDVIMGLTAPFVGFFLTKNHRVLKIWNMIGILMILIVVIIVGTGAYFPSVWGESKPIVSAELLTMPYLLLAGFLAPSAIFIHTVSLIQLRSK